MEYVECDKIFNNDNYFDNFKKLENDIKGWVISDMHPRHDLYFYLQNPNNPIQWYSIDGHGRHIWDFKQISEDEFFVISMIDYRYYGIDRIKLGEDHKVETNYSDAFSEAYKINDDKILMIERRKDYFGRIYFNQCKVYSVSENKNLEDFLWLSTGYNISALKSEDGNTVLYVTKTLKSKKENENENDYIQFLVDTQKFEPISGVYSTLRGDKPINVSSKEDVLRIINEDINCKPIVDDYFANFNDSQREKAKEKLLSK